jgi:chromosome segregation ATPase
MTRHVWIHDGRKADAATLSATLSAARADKMRRLDKLRMEMQAEAASEADARALHKATKKRLREIDRELRKLDAHESGLPHRLPAARIRRSGRRMSDPSRKTRLTRHNGARRSLRVLRRAGDG